MLFTIWIIPMIMCCSQASQVCDPGKYGANCTMHCSPGCQNMTCDRQNGTCDPCSEGYTGDMCSECAFGYFRATQTENDIQLGYYKINQTNNDTQLGYYKANQTNNDTQLGYYKANQTNNVTCQPCSEGCDDERLCDVNGGKCNGCDDGLHGALCEVNCTARCKYCDQDDGMCTLCRDNLKTPNCTDCIGGYLFKLTGVIACVRCLGICQPGTVCNQSTGFCSFCPPGKEGDYCEIDQVSDAQKKALIAGSVATGAAVTIYGLHRYIGNIREKAGKKAAVAAEAATARAGKGTALHVKMGIIRNDDPSSESYDEEDELSDSASN